ncbi:MAG TPA: glycosyltransferase family 2 protein [Patescibacteria group bacterium]|nr:glycosyltransferase family 2 protein [Patescibacteria group bacterium]
MNNKTKLSLPTLSVIIVTKNNRRTLPRLLRNIESQDYPRKKLEVIIVDGNSTDGTIDLIKSSRLKIKLVFGKKPNDPETCKGEGLHLAKGEMVALIDSDNYLPNNDWFRKMVTPLLEDKNIVGSFTWRFAYRKKDIYLNRYFSLIGSADPVGLYLGKADKMSYISDKWTGFGSVIRDEKDYFVVRFDREHFPTLGSNGFIARRKYLLKGKSDMNNFFHIDVPFDILKFKLSDYAVVRDVVIHDTAIALFPYVIKRARYMMLHYQKRSSERRYKVFDPARTQDIIGVILFIIFSCTFIQPFYISIRGYLKKPDIAWFIHPIFCFSIFVTYIVAILIKLFKGLFMTFTN